MATVKSFPAATSTTKPPVESAEIGSGVRWGVRVPSPNWPVVLSPQAKVVKIGASDEPDAGFGCFMYPAAMLWVAPAAIALINAPPGSATVTGVARWIVVPSPS